MKPIKTTKELKQRLENLAFAISDRILSPNYGGCGVIAGKVGTALQKLGIDCEVVTPVGSWWGSMPANVVRKNVSRVGSCKEWDTNGLDRSHLAVRFKHKSKTFCWDSDGLTGSQQFGKNLDYTAPESFGEGLTVQECVKISSRQRGWNRQFDRAQIPDITKLVCKHLLNGEPC